MRDPSLTTTTFVAALIFAAIALYTGKLLEIFTRTRRLKRPHRTLELIFRLWFAALALGALYLAFHGR